VLRPGPTRYLTPLLAIGALILAGCGATTERGSETFYREHAAEASQAAAAARAVAADVGGLPAKPSTAALEAIAVAEHRTRRDLLAASKWTVSENGEEEGVSQAEKEVNEATGALLQAMTDIRIYAQDRRPVALANYRKELALGREYWDQGITQLWFVAHKAGPPKI
jgi:hypothetical protein